jgi:hypothetical protein
VSVASDVPWPVAEPEPVSILSAVASGMYESIGRSDCDEGLAGMLCDQFVALGYRRPAVARVVQDGDVALLVLAWWEEAGRDLLNAVAPTLGELVGLDARREVVDLRTAVTPDGRRAMVSFVLGAETEDGTERRVALRNWAEQVRRNAASRQVEYQARREELWRFRLELRRVRAEARARFQGMQLIRASRPAYTVPRHG